MKLILKIEPTFHVYVEKLPYLKFEFKQTYFLVHFTMLGPKDEYISLVFSLCYDKY
jgi:hypothetical protein